MKDGRFSRDAIDAVGWRGKLCMVNVKGNAAKEGAVYDVVRDSWEEMPDGMIAGWNGPVAAMDEDDMFVVDEEKGAVRRYDQEKDGWEEVVASPLLRGAQQMAAGGGRVCVVCGDGEEGIVVVDVVARPSRIWVVELPDGFDAVAVHVLPRMSRPEVYVLPVASAD
ncbi:F-box/kelch-repeat protein SKIP25 [Linum perenne]